MRVALKSHPQTQCRVATAIEVDAVRPRPGVLELRYVLSGDVERLLVPTRAAPVRADELWRHTCFEAFIAIPRSESYFEFNFSPSTQWAAYHFQGYRDRMSNAVEIPAPVIEIETRPSHFELRVGVSYPNSAPWRLALCAVIEATGGEKSYWALAHPPGEPDFHHADGFVLELP